MNKQIIAATATSLVFLATICPAQSNRIEFSRTNTIFILIDQPRAAGAPGGMKLESEHSLGVSAAFGNQDLSDWRKVKKEVGSPVTVIEKSGNRYEGYLRAVTDDSLKIEDRGQTREIGIKDIAEVQTRKKAGGSKAAWIGGLSAAGFAVGALIGKVTNPDDESGLGSFGPLIGGAIGAAGGAVTGAVISSTRGPVKVVTIYKAP